MERSVKILHAADLHLDSPFEALGPEHAAKRRAEQRELPKKIVALARERGADIILLSGDLLDSGSAYLETAEELRAALSETELPVFIAPGNHDWYGPRSPYAKLKLPENVHIFEQAAISCVPLPELGVRVWGAAFESDACPPLLRGFEAEKDGDTLDVMALHGDPLSADSKYDPVTETDLARSGMDYVALGHVHKRGGPLRAGETWYAWPGCPEGRGFDECGERGVFLVTVGAGSCEAEFIPTSSRRYESIEVSLTDAPDAMAAIEAALPEDTARDIYRVTLTGEAASTPDIPALTAALSPRFFRLELRDRTRPRRDLWEKCGEDTLRGLFLSTLRKKYDAAKDETERDRISRAALYGLRALDNGDELN